MEISPFFMMTLKAGAVVAWQSSLWSSCCALPEPWPPVLSREQQGRLAGGCWGVAALPTAVLVEPAVPLGLTWTLCVIPSPKMASKPFAEQIMTLVFGADLLFCSTLVLNVLDFQGLAVCGPVNLSDVTERNQFSSWEEAGEALRAPHLALDTASLCIPECFSCSWCRLQQGIICGAVSMVFFLPQLLELFDHSRLPRVLNVLFFGAHNYSHVPIEC